MSADGARQPGARRLARGALGTMLALAASAVLAPPPARLDAPPSPVLTWRDGTVAHVALAPDDRWRIAADLTRVDPDLVRALAALEDQRLGWHPGVDPIAIARAALSNLTAGRVVSGASTVPMQVVRMVEPRPRTLPSKLVEAWRAVGLTLRRGTGAMTEAWLTFAPYGGNVEGVEAASWMLFGHGAEALSPDEITLLLAIPQDPNGRSPRPDRTASLAAARDTVAARIAPAMGWDAGVLELVARAPVPDTLRPMPRRLPHVAATLASTDARRVTSLDEPTTRAAERALAAVRQERAAQGIRHAAVLVVDLHTGELRAAVGGHDGWSDAPGAQIAAFDVPRSPGSTLKPLLYARALDQGLITPDRLVQDVPRRYQGWTPENYDGSHSGVVRARDALSRSLNLPFVDLLDAIGVDAFLGTLREAGASHLDPRPGHYGLSLASGGVEVTALELAALYLPIAGDGRLRPLRWAPVGEAGPAGPPLITPGAAWLTREALRLRDRPDFPQRKDLARLPPRIAWKTGTSQGHRDAWAVGFDGTSLAVVWMGNLDQRASAWLVGADAAGEVLFDLLEGLGRTPSEDPPPADVTPVTTCALSGHRPGPACPTTSRTPALAEVMPNDPCPYHQTVEVDATTGQRVGPGCREGRATRPIAVLAWPPAVQRWMAGRLGDLPSLPAWAPGCAPLATEAGPRILAPAPGQVLLLAPGRSATDQQVELIGEGGSLDAHLTWVVDGALVPAGPDGRTWWTPSPGVHELVLVDAGGQVARRRVEVRPL